MERRHVDTRTGVVVDNPPIRPFADWLREQASGRTHDELGEALYDLASKVRDTGKKGTLTLTITVDVMPNSDDGVLVVSDEIKLRLPEFPRKPSLFYTGVDGNLSRSDPWRLRFDGLRELPAGVDVRGVEA